LGISSQPVYGIVCISHVTHSWSLVDVNGESSTESPGGTIDQTNELRLSGGERRRQS